MVKGEFVVEEITADHIETGTHWVKFYVGGKITGLFSAGSIVHVTPKDR